MTIRIHEFIAAARAQLLANAALEALHDPLGGLVGLIQAGPGSARSGALRSLAHGIFNDSRRLERKLLEDIDRPALLVICRLAEEHLACRYSGEEWGDALKAIDSAIAAAENRGEV